MTELRGETNPQLQPDLNTSPFRNPQKSREKISNETKKLKHQQPTLIFVEHSTQQQNASSFNTWELYPEKPYYRS